MNLNVLKNYYNRKYKLDLESSKNFDEYMKAIGVSFMTRKLGVAVKPVVELTEESDGRLTLSSKSSFKNVSITFTPGEEFDEITPDGRKVKSVVFVEGNKLVQKQKNGLETETIREFTADNMIIVYLVQSILDYCIVPIENMSHPKAGKLIEAAVNNDLKLVKFFIEKKGVPATVLDYKKETLVHIAARNCNLDMVKYIVEKEPTFLTEPGRHYVRTALQLAVEYDAVDIVKFLIETFRRHTITDPKESDLENIIPLVVEYGRLNILKYFIEEKNVDMNMPGKWQHQPPIFSAVEFRHHDMVKYLVEENKVNVTATDLLGENILYVAVRRDDLTIMKYLLDEKKIELNVNSKNERGETLCHIAAFLGRMKILEYLVDVKHSKVNVRDKQENRTALHFGAIGNHYNCCKYLLEHGANPRIKDDTGQIPAEITHDPSLRILLEPTSAKRDRRAVDVPYSLFKAISVKPEVTLLGGMSHSYVDRSLYLSQFQNFLLIATLIRDLNFGFRHRCLGSQPHLKNLQKRMDRIAVDAINNYNLPDVD